MLGQTIKGVTFTQLIQDKTCKFQHRQTDQFCRNLSDLGDNDNGTDIKTAVILASSNFQMYYLSVSFIPSIIVCLFLGSWCDNYKPGRKILMYVCSIGITLETAIQAYMAYNFKLNYWFCLTGSIPSALGGGLSTAFLAVYSYIPATTPPDLSTIRFMFCETLSWLANPMATLLGGYLLNIKVEHPIGGNGQVLNYELVFIVSGVLTILALFWAIFFVNEDRDKKNLVKFSNDPAYIFKQIEKAHHKKSQNRPLDSIVEKGTTGNPFKLLFNWGNVREVFKTATKRRPNRVRLQIWLIIFSFVFLILAFMAPFLIMFPFTQKVYLWDSKSFSINNSLALLLSSFGSLFGTMILIRLLKFDDLPLAIFGITMFTMSSIVRATFINIWGFWAASLVGCFGGMGTIGIRAYISKIVRKDEIGKIFSLISSIDASVPLLGNLFFTIIFTYTLDTFPGAVWDANAAILFFPLLVLMFIDAFLRKGIDCVDYNSNNSAPNDFNEMRSAEQLTYRTRHAKSSGQSPRQPSRKPSRQQSSRQPPRQPSRQPPRQPTTEL